MRNFSHFIIAAAISAFTFSAQAQGRFDFGGLLNGLTKPSAPKNTNDTGNLIGNLVKATKSTSEPEEIRIGQEFAAQLLGAKPLVTDARLQRYVNLLGRWLSLHTERPDLPWSFGVLEDAGYNAFATPGGYIFVTRGLIESMGSEAELAGVLAHEMGHVLMKHHLKAVQKNAGFSLVGDLIGTATNGANDQLKTALLDMGRKLYTSGLDKSDEFEADRIGVVIAARAGYDAYGLPSVLQALQAKNAEDDNFSLMFKTHPTPAARIEILDSLMKNKFDGLPAYVGKPPNKSW